MPPVRELRKDHIVLAFFFVTGLTGLAYEVVWIRLLILSFGSTQFAVTTVLSTFMAGLALGSAIFGRVVDRSDAPLRTYAVLIIALGAYCIASPLVFSLVKGVYLYASPITGDSTYRAGFEPAQFGLSLLALIVPTTLMGGTLPAVVKHFASTERIGFHIAVPYAVNTLGAVTGCLATGLFSLYYLGVSSTLYLAGAVDIIAGLLLLAFFRHDGARKAGPAPVAEAPCAQEAGAAKMRLNAFIISAFFLSGFASLAYEVLWTRILSLVLGSSVYAFTIMLSTFLAGIGLGSIAFAPLVDRLRRPVFWFALLEAVIGLFALASIFLYKELPFVFFNLKQAFGERFWLFLVFKFLMASMVMIVPALAMGALFPLVNRIYSEGRRSIGKRVGNVYFFNTSGAILGSFSGGFILIPWLGAQNGVVLIAALNMAICISALAFSGLSASWKSRWAAAFAAIYIVTALMLPSWERQAMTTGMYANDYGNTGGKASFRDWAFNDKLLYYNEGLNAVITVRSSGPDGETLTYQANGKQEARSDRGKPPASWTVLGHIPAILHRGDPRDALLIGLGSGVTLGMLELYPFSAFDVVELEPAVVDAARFFSRANNNALEDPRVRLHVTDGRSFLSSVKRKYDVIVSGVSDPWISGVSNLFTYDYFMELKGRLNDGGIVAVWFSNYNSTPEDFKTGLNSFAAAFPHASVWFHFRESLDLVVIGSVGEHPVDMARLRAVFADRRIRESLQSVDMNTPYDFFGLHLAGDAELRKYIGDSVINTDERPVLEFSLPKSLYRKVTGPDRVAELLESAGWEAPGVVLRGEEPGEFYLNLGKSYNQYAFRLEQARRAFLRSLESDPGNAEARVYAERLGKELGR
ncbi:MAG: fused MFS/spermidine synthase [Thermodesulfobacteriota bacterium]|nr:MAG: fused MFS/spermidine synthase [Thermodesulfobacteriota bacterium]